MYERLQKILAQSGVASRRAAEKLIVDGRVRVNGEVVSTLGAKADSEADTIEVEGHGTLSAEPLVYVLLHKPPQVVTTVHDPEGRHTVLDVMEMSRARGKRQFEGRMPRIYPVGRLDFDAEGALILTNDGELTHRLLHPKGQVPKTYLVKVRGRPEAKQLERLRRGVRLKDADGKLERPTRPAEVQVAKLGPSNTWLELTLFEGRHHQVKRMCEAIGHGAVRLIRTDFAGIPLDDLPTGGWRYLRADELKRLRGWSDEDKSARRPARKPKPQSASARRTSPKSPTKKTTKKTPGTKRRSGAKHGKGSGSRSSRR